MSYAIMANPITTGVRRLRTLGGLWGLGTPPDPDTINELVAAGYDSGDINTAVAMGATNEQLLALPYPADPATEAEALATLINQLGGALPAPGASASTAPSYPAAAQPTTINNPFTGSTLDLLQQSSWDYINSLFVSAQQRLNALAAQNPKDPTIVSMVSEFNSNVTQWANYYDQAVGNAPSPIPMASIPGLSGLGIAPLVIVGIVAGVALLVTWLYGFVTNALAAKEQANAALINAQNQQALILKYNQAVAAGDTKTAQAILPSIQSVGAQTTAAGQPVNWQLWFQQNAPILLLGLAAIVILPGLLRRR
jgi:hypothetical protein